MNKKLMLFALCLFLMKCGIFHRRSFDPLSREFYDKARLIMTGEERHIFKHLPDQESRHVFIGDFWEKRDPDPDTEINEYKNEFFRRIEYANQFFREGIPGWKTDRGRIYIYFGPPDDWTEKPMHLDRDVKSLLVWSYYDHKFMVQFTDTIGDGTYRLNRFWSARGDNIQQHMERLQKRQAHTSKDSFGNRLSEFKLVYSSDIRKFLIYLPLEDLVFRDEQDLLKAEFDFTFYIYGTKGDWSRKYRETRSVAKSQEELLTQTELIFSFPFDLDQGSYYVDVVIVGRPEIGKTREVFKISVYGQKVSN